MNLDDFKKKDEEVITTTENDMVIIKNDSTTVAEEATAGYVEIIEEEQAKEEEIVIGNFDFTGAMSRRMDVAREKIAIITEEINDNLLNQELNDIVGGESLSDDEIDLDSTETDEFSDEEEFEIIEAADEEPTPVRGFTPKEVVKEPKAISFVGEAPKQSEIESIDKEDEDLLDILLDEDAENNEERAKAFEEIFAAYTTSIVEKLKMFDNKHGVTGTVKKYKDSISVNSLLEKMNEDNYTAEFPLFSRGELATFRGLTGEEIELIGSDKSLSKYESAKRTYTQIYDAIVSEKPDSLSKWAKSISFYDIDQLYMGLYAASFHGSNHLTYTCEECNNIFLTDNIKIENMYEFETDVDKERFNSIVDNGTIDSSKLYETKIYDISKYLAIEFREPSIYNAVFEISMLPEEFVNKYINIIKLLIFVENVYLIKDGAYQEISIPKSKDTNVAKELKTKILTYGKILKNLRSDQYQTIRSIINDIEKCSLKLSFVQPEVHCPKCDAKIEKSATSSQNLLFLRHQLPAIANSSLK